MDTPERFLHHAEQLFFVCALPKQEIFGIRARSPIDDVSSHGVVNGAPGLLFLGDTSTELLLAGFQPFTKFLQPFPVHSISQSCDYSAATVGKLSGGW